jgi:hypothetical protein
VIQETSSLFLPEDDKQQGLTPRKYMTDDSFAARRPDVFVLKPKF